MRKLFIFTIILVLGLSVLLGQEQQSFSRNAIYTELLGPGILYSVNYEFRPVRMLSLRAGFSIWRLPTFWLFIDGWLRFNGFPLTASYLLGQGSHSLEIGGGIMPVNVEIEGEEVFFGSEIEGSGSLILGTGIFGYRYQPSKGAFIKCAATPLFSGDNLVFTIGISTGYSF